MSVDDPKPTTQKFVTAADLARLTGRSERYFQKLARSGKLPFAHQPMGPRTAIYFDLVGFHRWLKAQAPIVRRFPVATTEKPRHTDEKLAKQMKQLIDLLAARKRPRF